MLMAFPDWIGPMRFRRELLTFTTVRNMLVQTLYIAGPCQSVRTGLAPTTLQH